MSWKKTKKKPFWEKKRTMDTVHTQRDTHTRQDIGEREWTKRDDLIGDGSPPFPPKAAKEKRVMG